jgi:hypothetical protein
MNTLKKQLTIDDSKLTTSTFRQFDYNRIQDILEESIRYINEQGRVKLIEDILVEVSRKLTYCHLYSTEQNIFKIFVKYYEQDEYKELFRIIVPHLIDGYYFKINGNIYTPALWLIDKPIIVKKNSIKISSRFAPLTIYIRNNIVKFLGVNIPLGKFLQMFVREDIRKEFIEYIDKTFTEETETNLYNYFSKVLVCGKTREDIFRAANTIFFDNYTKQLFKRIYNLSTFEDIVNEAITKFINEEEPNFVDLNNKRLVFVELLLNDLFKKIGEIAFNNRLYNSIDKITVDSNLPIRTFYNYLHSNFLYSMNNLVSGIPIHKTSMLPPGINSDSAPKTISSIHSSHMGKICPVSISNERPGHSVFVIPEQPVDEFGLFC